MATVLSLNSGSSSLKVGVYATDDGDSPRLVARGAGEGIGDHQGRAWLRGPDGSPWLDEARTLESHGEAVELLLGALGAHDVGQPAAAGHRVVHGGAVHAAPALVDDALLRELDALVPFAPLHLPPELLGIRTIAERMPRLPQVACFDTAFHRRMPELAQRFPFPESFWERGVRRYGFHGLSYEYLVDVAGVADEGCAVLAHLGNGASMAAVRDRMPMDTTMGLTPTGGFMMGTRSGDLDPGVLVFLHERLGYDVGAIDELVNHESGLLGVSGRTVDMRELLAVRDHDPAAALAVDLFCYGVRKAIGSLAAALGGLDTLVFTAGIGEHSAPVRAEVCAGLGHLGVALDAEANDRHAGVISTPESGCRVRVVPTDEEVVIARHTVSVALS